MLFFSDLRGFGAIAPGPMTSSAGSGGGSTGGIPKSDYIKQLQCLLNFCILAPEMGRAFQANKEMWNNALAWDAALPGGLPVTGSYRTSWPTENDAIWLLSRGGIPEFANIDSAQAPVDSNLLGYIQSCLAFLQRSGEREGYWIDTAQCNFPGRTQAALDAAAAAAAAAQAAAAAAAQQKAITEAEAAAKAAAKAAAEAAAAHDAESAAIAAAEAQAAADAAQTKAAQDAANRAAVSAELIRQQQAAQQQQQQQQQQPSAGARTEIVDSGPSPSTPTPQQQAQHRSFMQFLDTNKKAVGIGLLLAALAGGVAYRAGRRR